MKGLESGPKDREGRDNTQSLYIRTHHHHLCIQQLQAQIKSTIGHMCQNVDQLDPPCHCLDSQTFLNPECRSGAKLGEDLVILPCIQQ